VLCVDDHPLILDGIGRALERESDMVLVAEATNGHDAVAAYRQHKPDVALIDLQMPGLNGIDVVEQIRAINPSAKELIQTIRNIHAGQRQVPPEIAAEMTKHLSADDLSPRELEVLRCISGGRSNKAVADRLQISEDTVKGHMRSILAKLGANDRLDAVLIAIKRGILDG
jgi:DNA-binding NarL/FixJ family response regulator